MSAWLLPHLACLLIAVPFLGALLLWTFPHHENSGARAAGLLVALIELVLAGYAWWAFAPQTSAPQFAVRYAWFPSFGVHFAVGLDGVAITLVLLTALLAPLVILASAPSAAPAPSVPSVTGSIDRRSRDFVALVLLLEGAMVGAFAAQDLLLFYCFWEGMLVPAYFLLGVFGGVRRIHATMQFFLYTMAGSMLLLVASIGVAHVGHADGTPSFLYADVLHHLSKNDLGPIELMLFAGFAVAFLIKVPLLPLHAWLSETYGQAPLTALVLLSGVMVKVGAYALLRYGLLLFPRAATMLLPPLLLLAVLSCLWAAWLAYGQTSLRRIVAYSSLSHMGLVVVGLFCMTPTSLAGSALLMVNHGITTGALFLWIGMLERRRRSSQLADLGGLALEAPAMAVCLVILALASIGLPGLNGFVGEFLILLGAFTGHGLASSTQESVIAQTGIVSLMIVCCFAAIYASWLLYSLEGLVWRSPVGRLLRATGALAVSALAALLVAPPTAEFAGGLLVRGLVPMTLSFKQFAAPLPLAACFCTCSVVMAAAYMLRGVERTLFGPVPAREGMAVTADLSGRERLVLAPLLALCFALGLYPQPLIETAMPTVVSMVQQFRVAAGWPMAAEPPSKALAPSPRNAAPHTSCPYLSQPMAKEPAR